ncbi:MAG: oligosaccharide flippase family protein [Pseudorhodobacter sp.]|nr:oligosaccharide flippase family protein [Pseudorhodobacter sp.]
MGTLAGGNTVGLALPILAAPILGRLYAPAEYGALAQYMAFSAILAVAGTLQFQHAIIAEKSDRAARQIVWLCLAAATGTGLVALVLVALAWPLWLDKTAAGAWLWFLPLSVAAAGIAAGGSFLANRFGHYRRLAALPVLQTTVTVALSVALGFAAWGSAGLLTAYLAGQAVQAVAFGLYLSHSDIAATRPNSRRLAVLTRRHWKFPAFTLPTEFAGQVNLQIPVFFLTAIGADATLGAFARARQLVSMPITTLGGAVAQVFRRDAAEQYRQTGTCRPLMRKTAGTLFAVGFAPFAIILWQGPLIFETYLGPNWREAGELARILAPMLLLRLMVSPLATVLYFTGHQLLDFRLMIGSAVILLLATSLGWALGSGAGIVWAFAGGYCLIYILYAAFSWAVA